MSMNMVGGSSASSAMVDGLSTATTSATIPICAEQLAHDLLGDLLLGFIDTVDVARPFRRGCARTLAGWCPTG